MERKEFENLMINDGFGYAFKRLMSEFGDELTTYEDLVEYCVAELEHDGDLDAVHSITKTLDPTWGCWIYDYMKPWIEPRPVQTIDDLDGFFDEEDE